MTTALLLLAAALVALVLGVVALLVARRGR
jgi:hypothetical protein